MNDNDRDAVERTHHKERDGSVLRGLLVRDQLKAVIMALLIVGQHDSDPINKRLVLQGDGRITSGEE